MALGQGTIFTASDAAKALRENSMDYRGQNPWTNAYNSVNLQTRYAQEQLDSSYSNQLIDAYISSQKQANAIRNSNLGEGFQELALQENEALLNEAFNSYRDTYLQNKASVEDTAAGYMSQIDKALFDQGTNQAKLFEHALNYLPYLYEKDSSVFDGDVNYGKFLVDDGSGGKRLMTSKELTEKMFTNKELNDFGIDYLNMIESYQSSAGVPTFGDYLAEKDRTLFDWSMSADPYNAGKSNRDTFRYLTGERSAKQWSPSNRISQNWYDDVAEERYTSFETGINDLKSLYESGHKSEGDATKLMEDLNKQYEDLKTYAKQTGVYDQEKFNAFEGQIAKYNETIKNPGKGNNRQNREWATSNALADYQELYNELFGRNVGVTGRTKSYEERNTAPDPVDVNDDGQISPSESLDLVNQDSPNWIKNFMQWMDEQTKQGQEADRQFLNFIKDPLWYISKALKLQ